MWHARKTKLAHRQDTTHEILHEICYEVASDADPQLSSQIFLSVNHNLLSGEMRRAASTLAFDLLHHWTGKAGPYARQSLTSATCSPDTPSVRSPVNLMRPVPPRSLRLRSTLRLKTTLQLSPVWLRQHPKGATSPILQADTCRHCAFCRRREGSEEWNEREGRVSHRECQSAPSLIACSCPSDICYTSSRRRRATQAFLEKLESPSGAQCSLSSIMRRTVEC